MFLFSNFKKIKNTYYILKINMQIKRQNNEVSNFDLIKNQEDSKSKYNGAILLSNQPEL